MNVERGLSGCARRASRGATAAALCLGMSGCGDEDRPPLLRDVEAEPIAGCEQFSYRTCDILERACQAELFGLMQCLYGVQDELELPQISALTEAETIAFFERETPSMPDPTLAPSVRALELLGLLDPGTVQDEDDLVQATLDGVLAFYYPATDEIVMIDRGEPMHDLDANSVLAHELIHALQYAVHDVGALQWRAGGETDATLAFDAVVEGEATLYQTFMQIAYSGISFNQVDFTQMFNFAAGDAHEATFFAGSPILTASSIFPYTYGTRFMGEQWQRGSAESLDVFYSTPPTSTLEVMLGVGEEAPPIEPIASAPVPLDGHSMLFEDVVGAWVAYALLLTRVEQSESSEMLGLARRWRGDHLWVYQDASADPRVTALWRTNWADRATAERFAELMGEGALDAAGLSVEVYGSSVAVVATEVGADLSAWSERLRASFP